MPTRPSLRISFGAGDVQLAEDGDQIARSFAAQAPKEGEIDAAAPLLALAIESSR
jgi:hypothetical protein